LLGFFGGQAAVDGVENGELRLLDRRDGVVDAASHSSRSARFPARLASRSCFFSAMSAFKWFMSSAIFAFTVAQFLVAVSFADLTS